ATVLVYGAPAQSGSVALDEQSIGGLAYDLHTFPDVPRFNDGELHVAACYDADVVLPHPGGDESQPVLWERMQREGTVLQPFVPPCAAWNALLETPTVAAHLGQGLRRLAAWAFQPQPLFAAFFGDRRASSVGGTPIDFSTFAPVAANRSGSLVFLEPLADAFQNATAGVPLGPIVVQALSGEGTPMELVEVELYVAGNQGEPAGATFCDPAATDPSQCANPKEFTQEAASGYGTAATFTGATLYKAGGFRICARATEDFRGGEQFTFTEACSGVFTLKNN
ncbi:MAG TPA: hypothetical protein VLA43_14935, partial [Longimicrobiales bacterium]|nr:hypothetical protein [Longimicrobiales bacterium]